MGAGRPPFPSLGLSSFQPFDCTQLIFDGIDEAVVVSAQLSKRPCVAVFLVISAVAFVKAGHNGRTLPHDVRNDIVGLVRRAAVT